MKSRLTQRQMHVSNFHLLDFEVKILPKVQIVFLLFHAQGIEGFLLPLYATQNMALPSEEVGDLTRLLSQVLPRQTQLGLKGDFFFRPREKLEICRVANQ